MATNVTYNGVELLDVLTKRFSQTAIYDPSGTDLEYHEFNIVVVGTCHTGTSTSLGMLPFVGNNPSDAEATIRALLGEPRRLFSMLVDGNTLLAAGPMPQQIAGSSIAFCDVNNGPKPRVIEISRITPNAFQVSFEITICKIECESLKNSAGVLSHRWSVEESFDQTEFSTRTTTGRLKVASTNLNPHAYRGWVVPPLQLGFERISQKFVTSRDGMELEYSLVDKQTTGAAPAPAKKWQCVHTVSTPNGASPAGFGELHVVLEGAPDVSKLALISLAAKICQSKLKVSQTTSAGKIEVFPMEAAFVDHVHTNTIEVRVRTKYTPSGKLSLLGPDVTTIGKPLDLTGYKPLEAPLPRAYGATTPTGLFVSYLQSPCNDNHKMQQAGTAGAAIQPKDYKKNGERGSSAAPAKTYEGTLTTSPGQYDRESSKGVYTYYRVDVTYKGNSLRVQLPLAGVSSDGATCRVVKLAAGVAMRIIKIVGECVGDWPAMPAPVSFQDKLGIVNTIMNEDEVFGAPAITANGSLRLHVVEAEYIYALSRPLEPTEPRRTAALPWDKLVLFNADFPADHFVDPTSRKAIA